MQAKIAIILAAGKGERLDISDKPKALVTVGHKPLILWNIEQLQEAGIEHLVVVVGHKGAQIRRELTAHPSLKSEPLFVDVGEGPGSMMDSVRAAYAALAERGIHGPTLLAMADVFFHQNPYPLLAAHPEDAAGVVVGTSPEHVHASGAQMFVEIQDGNILKIARHGAPAHGSDTGVYVFPETMHAQIREQGASFDELLASLAENRSLRAISYPHAWFDVNTPETCIRAELFFKKNFTVSSARTDGGVALQQLSPDTSFKKEKHTETKIYIRRGLLDQLDTFQFIPDEYARSPHFIITDTKVGELYGQRIVDQMKRAGYDVRLVSMGAGEHSKTFETYQRLAEYILGQGIDERSIIFSLGGGVVGNVAGFLASTLYRGVGLIHIPTTLMSQVDAAVGIKQAVNGERGKNLIGSYYEPLAILIDPNVVQSLPLRLIRDGLAECLKHALVQDAEFVKFFRSYTGELNDVDFLEKVIRKNIDLKIELMEKDYKEDREGMVLQYGHEVGHAVEYLSGYSFYHGESIIFGMRASAELAVLLGICDKSVLDEHLALFKQYGYVTEIPENITPAAILDVLRFTKKARGGDMRFALPASIGSLWHVGNEYAIPCALEYVEKAVKRCYAA